MITLKNVSKSFEGKKLYEDVNLTIEDGAFLCFSGPSGCGKSTITKIIAGIENLDLLDQAAHVADKASFQAVESLDRQGPVGQAYEQMLVLVDDRPAYQLALSAGRALPQKEAAVRDLLPEFRL